MSNSRDGGILKLPALVIQNIITQSEPWLRDHVRNTLLYTSKHFKEVRPTKDKMSSKEAFDAIQLFTHSLGRKKITVALGQSKPINSEKLAEHQANLTGAMSSLVRLQAQWVDPEALAFGLISLSSHDNDVAIFFPATAEHAKLICQSYLSSQTPERPKFLRNIVFVRPKGIAVKKLDETVSEMQTLLPYDANLRLSSLALDEDLYPNNDSEKFNDRLLRCVLHAVSQTENPFAVSHQSEKEQPLDESNIAANFKILATNIETFCKTHFGKKLTIAVIKKNHAGYLASEKMLALLKCSHLRNGHRQDECLTLTKWVTNLVDDDHAAKILDQYNECFSDRLDQTSLQKLNAFLNRFDFILIKNLLADRSRDETSVNTFHAACNKIKGFHHPRMALLLSSVESAAKELITHLNPYSLDSLNQATHHLEKITRLIIAIGDFYQITHPVADTVGNPAPGPVRNPANNAEIELWERASFLLELLSNEDHTRLKLNLNNDANYEEIALIAGLFESVTELISNPLDLTYATYLNKNISDVKEAFRLNKTLTTQLGELMQCLAVLLAHILFIALTIFTLTYSNGPSLEFLVYIFISMWGALLGLPIFRGKSDREKNTASALNALHNLAQNQAYIFAKPKYVKSANAYCDLLEAMKKLPYANDLVGIGKDIHDDLYANIASFAPTNSIPNDIAQLDTEVNLLKAVTRFYQATHQTQDEASNKLWNKVSPFLRLLSENLDVTIKKGNNKDDDIKKRVAVLQLLDSASTLMENPLDASNIERLNTQIALVEKAFTTCQNKNMWLQVKIALVAFTQFAGIAAITYLSLLAAESAAVVLGANILLVSLASLAIYRLFSTPKILALEKSSELKTAVEASKQLSNNKACLFAGSDKPTLKLPLPLINLVSR